MCPDSSHKTTYFNAGLTRCFPVSERESRKSMCRKLEFPFDREDFGDLSIYVRKETMYPTANKSPSKQLPLTRLLVCNTAQYAQQRSRDYISQVSR